MSILNEHIHTHILLKWKNYSLSSFSDAHIKMLVRIFCLEYAYENVKLIRIAQSFAFGDTDRLW